MAMFAPLYGSTKKKKARLHCRLPSPKDQIKNKKAATIKTQIKAINLVPLEANEALETFLEPSPPIHDEVLVQCFKKSIEQYMVTATTIVWIFFIVLSCTVLLLQNIREENAQDSDYCLP
jgi:hypothetical protein